MRDENFERAMIMVFEHEGGYVNHPNDPGGETKYGISKRSYPNVNIRKLTKEGAKEIYKKDWWDRHQYGKISSPDVSRKAFDMAINMGARRAHKILQRAINNVHGSQLAVDGAIGPNTLRVCNECSANDDVILMKELRHLHGQYYQNLIRRRPSMKVFEKGWMRRARS